MEFCPRSPRFPRVGGGLFAQSALLSPMPGEKCTGLDAPGTLDNSPLPGEMRSAAGKLRLAMTTLPPPGEMPKAEGGLGRSPSLPTSFAQV